jgi:putative sterol carrier protein
MAPIVNIFWRTCIDEGVNPKEFVAKGMVPRPDSIETFATIMKMAFNPDKAGDTKAKVQFVFSGEVEGMCYFSIENGRFEATLGTVDTPDLTIETPFEVWMNITTRKADGQQMFMEQKYRVSGDISVLMRFGDFFGK